MKNEPDLRAFRHKRLDTTEGGPPRVSNEETFWSWLGAFRGIGTLAMVGTL